MPPERRLLVQEHVKYIQDLDSVREMPKCHSCFATNKLVDEVSSAKKTWTTGIRSTCDWMACTGALRHRICWVIQMYCRQIRWSILSCLANMPMGALDQLLAMIRTCCIPSAPFRSWPRWTLWMYWTSVASMVEDLGLSNVIIPLHYDTGE